MSLLIKALANAEKDKQVERSKRHTATHGAGIASTLELAPTDNKKPDPAQAAGADAACAAADTTSRTSTASAAYQDVEQQKVAANVFEANKSAKTASSKSALVLLGIAGALAVWLGIEGYRYLGELATPDTVVVKPAPIAPLAADALTAGRSEPVAPSANLASTANQDATETTTVASLTHADTAKTASQTNGSVSTEPGVKATAGSRAARHGKVKETLNERPNSGDAVKEDGATQLPAQQASLKLTSRTPVAAVDPTLLSAYQAFSRGEDASAQRQYRQVLQQDMRNVDALLGMAAIAQRQGRDADAVGWYQKVLEIEPRNTIAQSAIAGSQANADVVGAESRIKNLLVQQPEAANLHAALGNLYAEQNQWAAAQQAYFNASRFAPDSADYAFNLAISLDQLGKPSLALAQYQRALGLLNSSGASSPDKAQLEARIKALQALN